MPESEQALCAFCETPWAEHSEPERRSCEADIQNEERHSWLRRYHLALEQGYSMSAAIHKANEDAAP